MNLVTKRAIATSVAALTACVVPQTAGAVSSAQSNGWVAFASTRTSSGEIYLATPDGGSVLRLTDDEWSDSTQEISPDGSMVAYSSYRSGEIDVFMMRSDGTGETRLTSTAGIDQPFSWSPDGTEILIASDRSGNRDI